MTTTQNKQAIVVGAGLAGASCAYQLACRGYQVQVLEKAASIATGASCITAANLFPRFDAAANKYAAFYYFCYQHLQAHWQELLAVQAVPSLHKLGFLLFIFNDEEKSKRQKFLDIWQVPPSLMRIVSAAEASIIAGIAVAHPALYLPENITVSIPQLCQYYLAHPNIKVSLNQEIQTYSRIQNGYKLTMVDDSTLTAPVLVLCNGMGAEVPTYYLRGQTTFLPAQPALQNLKTVLSFGRSLMPAHDGVYHLGSSFDRHLNSPHLEQSVQDSNLHKLKQFLPDMPLQLPSELCGQVGFRLYSKDQMPVIGAVPNMPDLYTSTGHGARGLLSCMVAAETIADAACGINNISNAWQC